MRVIAGIAKRTPLKTPPGLDTRPTTDRIKETLFNMLQYELADCRFLDLFAGSGGIGIEALSRGAAECVFVEQNPVAAACVRDNLRAARLENRGTVIQRDALSALKQLEGKGRFDLVFMDPPYDRLLERQMLEYLAGSELIDRESTLIVEARLDTDFSYLDGMGYTIEKEKRYKTNKHLFLYRSGGKDDGSGLSGEL